MRKPRFKAAPDCPVAYYHCTSRVVNRSFIFGEQEKLRFRRLMREYATFSGVGIVTHCLMDNHFHMLVEGKPEVLSVIAAYIDLNSIRAGAVKDPKDYHWSGYGEAMGGNQKAQEALMQVLPPGHKNLDA